MSGLTGGSSSSSSCCSCTAAAAAVAPLLFVFRSLSERGDAAVFLFLEVRSLFFCSFRGMGFGSREVSRRVDGGWLSKKFRDYLVCFSFILNN